MKLNYTSGKKFHSSIFQHENYRLLKKDEERKKAIINLVYLVMLLILEYVVLSFFTR